MKSKAINLLRYYLSHIVDKTEASNWDSDNDSECEEIVEAILAEARDQAQMEFKDELQRTQDRITALEAFVNRPAK
jgi:hypothetical protein